MLMCKISKVCMEYFVACNYFWLLVEAVFLHTLLFTAVLTKRRLLKRYMLLGWGKTCESVKLATDITVASVIDGRHQLGRSVDGNIISPQEHLSYL